MIKYRKITDISFVTDTMSICRKTDIESADTTPNKHRGGGLCPRGFIVRTLYLTVDEPNPEIAETVVGPFHLLSSSE